MVSVDPCREIDVKNLGSAFRPSTSKLTLAAFWPRMHQVKGMKRETHLVDLDYYDLFRLSKVNFVLRANEVGDQFYHYTSFEGAVVTDCWTY
jgi:hypothetical protein